MRQRSRRISRISGGTKTTSHSKSPRPPSLKPALSREAFRRLQTQRDFQSPKDSTGFQPVVIKFCLFLATCYRRNPKANKRRMPESLSLMFPELRTPHRKGDLTPVLNKFERMAADGDSP